MAIGRQRETTERIHVMMKAETRVTKPRNTKLFQLSPEARREPWDSLPWKAPTLLTP